LGFAGSKNAQSENAIACTVCERCPNRKLKDSPTMFWNLFRLQALLDSLFDDGWLSMGVPEKMGYDESAVLALMLD